ncbi:MOSC domain-containing protein [Actinomadura xylanilytica]|uniref:MOSC domain-containing protein n=1 Tax=Actinomadura xylanilytica TaxID=887459 RepID=UPI00255AB53A|nr:MOSC N-terminal beta barrel domain-containing protein [Actinomadura xylanilytica]MDL4776823.1 MOSC N-terminal beta barrel domain-containing protein [Actinomadura xylanilytica]
MVKIVGLNCHPVKGCAGTALDQAVLTPAGIAHDRTFMVTGTGGVFRSLRRDPRLALVRPRVSADGALLTLRTDGSDAITVAVDLTGPRREVRMFGDPYPGIDQGDTAAEWLSDVLGSSSRLVRLPPEYHRVTDGLTPGTAGYADGSAVHLTAVSSLAALNERIAARGAGTVPMSRFRPNIVIDGWDEPHLEDRIRRAAVGDAELGFTKLAIRCAVTVVDQAGRRAGPEPLRTLAGYRRTPDGVAFGVKFSVTREGKVSVGDELTVTAW